jgi:hypothetical protein
MTIAQWFNQNSFLVAAIAVWGGAFLVLIARRARPRAWLACIAGATAAAGIAYGMRTAAPQTFDTADDVQRAVSAGAPTLVEFYSDF